MRSSVQSVAVLLGGALLLAPSYASAQPDFERQEAQQRFDEGNKLYAGAHYEEARVKFNQAWATLKRPNVLFNLARAEHYTGRSVEAARHYRAYLRLSDPKITTTDRDAIQKYLADLDLELGRLAVSAPPGTRLVVDGEALEDETTAEPIEVRAGTHAVQGLWSGKKKEIAAVAKGGAVTPVVLSFDETTAATPVASPALLGGPSIEPPREEPKTQTARLITSGILLGVGLASAGVGVGFAVGSNNAADRLQTLRRDPSSSQCPGPQPACADMKAAADDEVSGRNGARIFIGGGVVLVAASVVTYLLWPTSRPRETAQARDRPQVTPLIGASAFGLNATGTF